MYEYELGHYETSYIKLVCLLPQSVSSRSSIMKCLSINIEIEDFWFNFFELKDSFTMPLPNDTIQYKCENCGDELSMFPNGEYYCNSDISSFDDLITKEKFEIIKSHKNDCMEPILTIHPNLGVPDNLIFLVKNIKQDVVKPFKFENIDFFPILLVIKDDVPALVIFQKNKAKQELYSKMITHNFDDYLNIPNPPSNNTRSTSDNKQIGIEDINNEEELHENQQQLPRLVGGGRSFLQEFKYVCQWCTHEQLQKKTRGRFREIKNYRDHFRNYHSDVPFSEFLNRVERQEPKWQCKICRQKMCLSNQLRHQVICRPKKYESSSSEEEEEANDEDEEGANDDGEEEDNDDDEEEITNDEISNDENEARNANAEVDNQSSPTIKIEPENVDEEEEEITRGRIRKRAISSSDSSSHENEDEHLRSVVKKVVMKINKHKIVDEVMKALANEESCNSSNDNQKEHEIPVTENIQQEQTDPLVKSLQVIDEVLTEETSDPYKFTDDDEGTEMAFNEKGQDHSSEQDKTSGYNILQGDAIIKWWQGIPQDFYSMVEGCPLEIFIASDSEEFKQTVINNYNSHTKNKKELDDKNEENEKSDKRFNLFSQERDKPFVDEYIEYVSNHSTKEIMNLLGTNADESSTQNKARSNTARQYSYKIMEFFNFMAKLYHGFHFDWFLDYSQLLEKKLADDNISTEIFIPQKQVLTDFIKSFMYGSNPAANCGIRIFAVKKMLEFLMQKYKDNEDKFHGDIVTRSKIVDSLTSKIKNMSEDLCPAGMIKHISIASNNNHRKALAEQMKKIPEKSIENIMKGVGEYLMSDDYTKQKEGLYFMAYEKTKVPSKNEYMKATNWLLEQLICIGGNRPCALLGLTVDDWENRKAGYCPFNQSEDNDLVEEDPTYDKRKILKDPYKRPNGCVDEEPTGVIVKSDGDKITIGPPCYIWFPNELSDLVQAHTLISSKFLQSKIDIHHPKTNLFLNSAGNPIKHIDCKTFKDFLGLPITAYDFRRSLSTFCFDSQNENIRKSEPSVLRHRSDTGFAYYFQKHSQVCFDIIN